MITLPKEKVVAKSDNPRISVWFGKPKSGKTSVVNALEDNLIIDFEGGSLYIEALSVQARTFSDIREIIKSLSETKKELGKEPYRFITLDSGSAMEDIARSYALKLYQATPMAKKKDGTLFDEDILTLPNGGGYLYLRQAFEKIYTSFLPYCEHLIIICHVKDKLINNEGKESTESAFDLTGKIANILAGKSDAIGYVYRKKNETYISFKGGGSIICESRCEHLRGKEFVVATSDENNKITFDVSQLFLPEK